MKGSSWSLRVYFICPWRKNLSNVPFKMIYYVLLLQCSILFNTELLYWLLLSQSALVLSCAFIYHLRQKNILIGLGKLELSFINDTFQKNGRKPGVICTLPVWKNNSYVWGLTLEMDLWTVNYLITLRAITEYLILFFFPFINGRKNYIQIYLTDRKDIRKDQ